MLTPEQEKFLHYWEANREREKTLFRQIMAGLPIGLSIGAGILICVFSGWYKRAMMELSTDVNPVLLIVAVIVIALMFGVFSQKQKWEMNEQAYLKLLADMKREQEKKQGKDEAPGKE